MGTRSGAGILYGNFKRQQKAAVIFTPVSYTHLGADGLAMARILSQNGWSVRIAAIGQIEKATKEWL